MATEDKHPDGCRCTECKAPKHVEGCQCADCKALELTDEDRRELAALAKERVAAKKKQATETPAKKKSFL
jgi:hypothetical protein